VKSSRALSPAYGAIYAAVSRIPRGRVATYGQIASVANLEGHARLVGYALHALPDGAPVPWHRVVNARGMVSRRRSGSGHDVLQRRMLEAEGVRFDREGRLSLAAFRWRPKKESLRGGNSPRPRRT
jgi:methylated-DNA-protein-cysteine methyltransferase-like protein